MGTLGFTRTAKQEAEGANGNRPFSKISSELLKSVAARVLCEHLLSSLIVRTSLMNVFCLDGSSG